MARGDGETRVVQDRWIDSFGHEAFVCWLSVRYRKRLFLNFLVR